MAVGYFIFVTMHAYDGREDEISTMKTALALRHGRMLLDMNTTTNIRT